MTSLRQLLEQQTVQAASGPIVTVQSTQSVTDVFSLLISNNILSAPVWNAKTDSFAGIIDVMDILMLFTEVFSRQELQAFSSLESIAENTMRFTKEEFNRHFGNHTRFIQAAAIDDMTGLSGVNPFVPVNEGESLWNIISLMTERHLHRVPVLRSPNELVNYTTQSSIVNFIHEHLDSLPESVRSKTIAELEFGNRIAPVTARDSDFAIDVFATMSQQGISAIPIVDDEGKFVGVLSSSDIKGIGLDGSAFPRLSLNVIDYIAPIRQQNLKARHPAISCHPGDSLEKVINKLAATRVHRLVITDADTNKVLGIVSLSDVLRYVHGSLA